MMKDLNCRFDDCSISPIIRQIWLHQGSQLIDKNYYKKQKIDITIVVVKKKTAEYYIANKDVLKEQEKK